MCKVICNVVFRGRKHGAKVLKQAESRSFIAASGEGHTQDAHVDVPPGEFRHLSGQFGTGETPVLRQHIAHDDAQRLDFFRRDLRSARRFRFSGFRLRGDV